MDEEEKKIAKQEPDALEKQIAGWQMWIFVFAVVLAMAYVFQLGDKCPDDGCKWPERWGQFGDFVGGIMNPLVAFAAFFWLTQSVKLQKQELADTRRELKASADAQQELVVNGRHSIELAALTALTSACEVNINLLKEEEKALYSKLMIYTNSGLVKSVGAEDIRNQIKENEGKVENVKNERDIYFLRMKSILEMTNKKQAPA